MKAKPKTKDGRYQVTVFLHEKELQFIDKIAKEIGLSRARMCQNLIEAALDDAKLFSRMGLTRLVGKKWQKEMDELADELFPVTT